MSCGYCSRIGHTMRHCNSAAAQNLLADYRRTCMTPRTDEELNQYFRSFTSDMLSLIMYSYGAISVFVNRATKEQFIRERILQARGQPALVIDLTAPVINQPVLQPGTPEGPPPPVIRRQVVRETMAGLRAQGLLPQAFVPHKPEFADIQLVRAVAADAEDYCCGICSDEFTKETISTLGCNHTICAHCITGQIKARTKSYIKCPFCREEVKQISVWDKESRNQLTYALVTA